LGIHVHLHGHLGAGKTTLVRGMLRAMGVKGAVKSPTYTLVEPYQIEIPLSVGACPDTGGTAEPWTVFHFDLYRLSDTQELELLGIRDYFHDRALCLFEWPERASGALPVPSLELFLELENEGRRLQTQSHGARGKSLEMLLFDRSFS
jgi:tRNA threonylcarbamoyladenosine biosynthesis protein TsaE